MGTSSNERVGTEDSRGQRASEHQRLFELAGVGMAEVELASDRILRVNHKLCAMTGYSREELSRMTFAQLIHAEDRELDQDERRDAASGRTDEWVSERRCQRKDGASRWVLISNALLRDEQARPARVLVSLQDIDERKRQEESLRQSAQRCWKFMNNSPANLSIRDAQGRYVYVNEQGEIMRLQDMMHDVTDYKRAEQALRDNEARFRAFFQLVAVGTAQADPVTFRFLDANERLCQMLGYSREELLSMKVPEITHPDDWERDRIEAGRLLRGEIPDYVAEKRYLRKDGQVRWGTVSVALVHDSEGKPSHTVVVVHDITARKRAEEALMDADRRKDEFLAMLAHELRNPLSAIQNALTLLRMPVLTEERKRWAGQVMERQIKQLSRLIDDLLDVSRITRGKIQLKREHIDLATVIKRAVESVAPLMSESRHELTVRAMHGLWVDGDPARLEQVLVNLLTNAAKYTERGGKVWLTLQQDGGEAVIRVRDTGVGIPAEMLQQIFEIFTQVHHTLDRSLGGLGIGLTLVKKLVEMHGGAVSASSSGKGEGSEFEVRLPLARPPKLTEGRAGGAAARPRANRRVLVVDDNKDGAMTLATLLELAGHETRVVHDGRAALAAAREFGPDVVLLDLGLPEMDGYQVARALRATEGLESVELIAISGYGQAEDRRRTREAGFDDHLLKPVDSQTLLERIASIA